MKEKSSDYEVAYGNDLVYNCYASVDTAISPVTKQNYAATDQNSKRWFFGTTYIKNVNRDKEK